jgi:predicted outer membrane repeat protein
MVLMCLLGTVQAFGQTANRSYYVRADGDDSANNGRSEEAPFKTLKKAIEMSGAGAVKTITVMGTVEGCRIENAGSSEILITGKPDASDTERALISSSVVIRNTKVKFTHVQITNTRGRGLDLTSAIVTLGVGVRITKCSQYNNERSSYGAGVYMDSGTLNMTDNAAISDNKVATRENLYKINGYGGGIYMKNSILNMSDNAVISGNTASSYGGGVSSNGTGGQINMSGNSVISGNTAQYGGGVAFGYDNIIDNFLSGGGASGSSTVRQINMSGNSVISGNTAQYGGGVSFGSGGNIKGGTITGNTAKRGGGVAGAGKLENVEVSGNNADEGAGVYSTGELLTVTSGKITGNSAKERGGGIFAGTCKMENVEISGNKAEYGAGYYVEKGKLTIAGGKITGNEAKYVGGGVYLKTGATYEAGKGASVTGNKAGDGEGEDVFRQ